MMRRNEIRLRRQRMAAGNIARHRNYGELMERHERDQKWKRLFKVFVYFLIAAFLIIIFVIVIRWEQRKEKRQSYYENIMRDSCYSGLS